MDVDLEKEDSDVYDTCELLKMYLRCLPDCMVTNDHIDSFLAVAGLLINY